MKQEFTKLEGGKIKWSAVHEEKAQEDKEFGKIGVRGGNEYIIFDNYEQALAVLDRDLSETQKHLEEAEKDLEKNKHNLDEFKELKDLIESVGKLHDDYKEINTDRIHNLYKDNPSKYHKVLKEHNKSKDYIKDELATISQEYQKYLNYQVAEKNYKFLKEQQEKIEEQKEKLIKVNE